MQSLQLLDHRARLVALESETSTDVLGLVRGIYGDVSRAFTNFTAQFSPEDVALNLNPAQRQLVALLNGKHYVGLEGVACFVPEGLKVSYLEYLAALKPAVDRTSRIMDNFLAPFAGFLAGLVNNHALASTAKQLAILDSHVDLERRTMNKHLGECFQAGSSVVNTTYEKVVARNSDWPRVFHDTDALVQAINRVDRNALQKKMAECVELMDVLKRQLEQGKFGDMSAATASNLAAGAYQVALELEFYSVVYYKAAALSGALNRTVQSVKLALTDKPA